MPKLGCDWLGVDRCISSRHLPDILSFKLCLTNIPTFGPPLSTPLLSQSCVNINSNFSLFCRLPSPSPSLSFQHETPYRTRLRLISWVTNLSLSPPLSLALSIRLPPRAIPQTATSMLSNGQQSMPRKTIRMGKAADIVFSVFAGDSDGGVLLKDIAILE